MAPPYPGGSMSSERGGNGTSPPFAGGEDQPIVNETSPLRASTVVFTDEDDERSIHSTHIASNISPPRGSGDKESSQGHQRRASDLRPQLGAGRTLITESGINIHRPEQYYDDLERAVARREDLASASLGYGGIPFPPSLTSSTAGSPSICSSEISWGKQMTMLLLVRIYYYCHVCFTYVCIILSSITHHVSLPCLL